MSTDTGPAEAQRFGDRLIQIHDWFRADLAAARSEVDAALAEGHPAPGLLRQLRQHCRSFCENLHGHHTMEDTRLFPSLGQDAPELRPVIARLRREHRAVSDSLDTLLTLADDAEPGDLATVKAEFERLAAELEAHLAYEEKHLVPLLNGGTAAG